MSEFLHKVRAGAGDIDGLSHVNNACYVKWCEAAAWAHSSALGVNLDDYQSLDRAMAIRHAEYDYIASAYEGDELEIRTWLSDFTNLSMSRNFSIKRSKDDKVLLKASWKLVCIEISSGRPKRLPDLFVEAYVSPEENV